MARCLILITWLSANAASLAAEPAAIGSRRELFVDDALVERLEGRAELRLHPPTPREVSLETSEAWEGNSTNYVTPSLITLAPDRVVATAADKSHPAGSSGRVEQ